MNTEFDDDIWLVHVAKMSDKAGVTHVLSVRSLADPTPIAEHENIGPRENTLGFVEGGRPDRKWRLRAQSFHVDFEIEVTWHFPYISRNMLIYALQVVKRAVAFDDALGIEARLLEVAVDVRREHEVPVRHPRRPLAQNIISIVRRGAAVLLDAVPEEPPGKLRVLLEPRGCTHLW